MKNLLTPRKPPLAVSVEVLLELELSELEASVLEAAEVGAVGKGVGALSGGTGVGEVETCGLFSDGSSPAPITGIP
jgi:hypothetical protein